MMLIKDENSGLWIEQEEVINLAKASFDILVIIEKDGDALV